MNPFSSRWLRTIILFALGVAASFTIAYFLTPVWPRFCSDTTVGAPCDEVAVRRMAGYLLMALGMFTMILGPIAGSFLDLAINGAKWETPRGTESVITTIPIVIGAIYLALGVLVAANS